MSLGFAAAVAKLGAPIAEFLLKHYISEGAAASGKGLIDIAAGKITDEESQRVAVRQFEDIGDKVVRRLLPLFENVEDVSAEAVAHEVGLTLATHLSAEFFLERDLDPAKLGIALRAERPLARGMFSQAEISLYERSLDEAIRYMLGVAQNLPRFEVQAAATALGRLSRIGGDLEKVLDGIARIERLVEQTDAGETTRHMKQIIVRPYNEIWTILNFLAPILARGAAALFKRRIRFTQSYIVDCREGTGDTFGRFANIAA